MSETDFIASLRKFANHPAARGLLDDAAVLALGEFDLVATHDMIVEGMHFLPGDPPADIAWKLLAVNLSDLAAKGAEPIGVIMGYSLAGDGEWDRAFVEGLGAALSAFQVPLLGGDTVSVPPGSARAMGLTALGRTSAGGAASRTGAQAGDLLWVSGTIGDAGAGLNILQQGGDSPVELVARYRRPQPRLEAGRALAPLVTAMMDVSDGLLVDAQRLASASGLALTIEIDAVPLSADFIAHSGDDRTARLAAATAGDDYELLFAAPEHRLQELLELARALRLPLTPIGSFTSGKGLSLAGAEGAIPLPERLGYQHGSS